MPFTMSFRWSSERLGRAPGSCWPRSSWYLSTRNDRPFRTPPRGGMWTSEIAAFTRSSGSYLSWVTTATSLIGPRSVVSHRSTSDSLTRQPASAAVPARAPSGRRTGASRLRAIVHPPWPVRPCFVLASQSASSRRRSIREPCYADAGLVRHNQKVDPSGGGRRLRVGQGRKRRRSSHPLFAPLAASFSISADTRAGRASQG